MRSTPRTRFAIAALLFASLGFSACGDDDDGGGGASDTAGEQTEDSSSGGTDGGESTESTDEGSGDGSSDGETGNSELGFCHVTVTGDVESDWTTDGGGLTVAYGPWLPESMLEPGTLAEEYFVLNCTGTGNDYVGFTANTGTGGVPMQPATYTFPAGAGSFAGSGSDLPIELIVALTGPDTVWDLGAEGTLVITEFDENHIAGTFELPVTDGLADSSGTDYGDALIVGEFDLANTY